MTENATPPPFAVAREQIPVATTLQEHGLRVRPFVGHELMARVASPGAELSWLEVPAGDEVAPRSHPEPTLLVVMRGRATVVGHLKEKIEQGDVLAVPGKQAYGFSSVESDLHVLLVTLHAQLCQEFEDAPSLERLLDRNRTRAMRLQEGRFFQLLHDGLLDTAHKRSAACEALRVFSDAFQTFLFTRQAMCRDEGYFAVFHGHLMEELGHNNLLKVSRNRRTVGDPILRATSSWFSHQMLTLDNAGKAVVNLVLETSGFYFHTLAKPVFSAGESAQYFDIHAEADADHMDLGLTLLANQHADTYRRLLEILDESWDMMDAVTTRFAELIEGEISNSSCAAQ